MKRLRDFIAEAERNIFGAAVVDLAKKLQDSPKTYHSQSDWMKKVYWPNRRKKEQDTKQKIKEDFIAEASPAWTRKEGKSEAGGLNRKGIESYRRENPGSKLSMAVTTKPSKLKPGSKSANRRKSFCARMGGMKKRLTSAETARDPDSRINKALRKWNC